MLCAFHIEKSGQINSCSPYISPFNIHNTAERERDGERAQQTAYAWHRHQRPKLVAISNRIADIETDKSLAGNSRAPTVTPENQCLRHHAARIQSKFLIGQATRNNVMGAVALQRLRCTSNE